VTLGKKMTGKGLPVVRKELFALGGGGLRPPSSRFFFSFLSFCNLLGVSCASFSNHPFAYTEIYIYSARVASRIETKFQSNSFFYLKFEFDQESNLKADTYHYLEDKHYLEDEDRMIKAHCSP